MHKGFDHGDFASRCCDMVDECDMAISYNAVHTVKDRFPERWNHIEFPLTYSMRADRANYREDQPNRNELLLINY